MTGLGSACSKISGDGSGEPLPPFSNEERGSEPPRKASYVGAPAIFALQLVCKQINAAFDGFGCYHVGSSLERPDWRDVDVRYIMKDADFEVLFPDAHTHSAAWEHDPRWLLLTVAISEYMSKRTGLPVDFQFHPQSYANKAHATKPRNPIGSTYVSRRHQVE